MDDDRAPHLGAALGGNVVDLHRLSGGASRVTSSFTLVRSSRATPLVLQEDRARRPGGATGVALEADLLRAAAASGVPVPEVVATGAWPDGRGWIVVSRLDGEAIPRKILRDGAWARARGRLVEQCGAALATIHHLNADSLTHLPRHDPLRDTTSVLDALGVTRPMTELAVRWLAVNAVSARAPVVVHGDFRMGNFLVSEDGLTGVLDWELAHIGDPLEDIGWLCARTWRFGGPGRVAGIGDLATLRAAYEGAGGTPFTDDDVTWWEIYAGAKWAAICAMQCAAHRSGTTRSVELATIGRRICESEWDVLLALGVLLPPSDETHIADDHEAAPFGYPTITELTSALIEQWDRRMRSDDDGASRYRARIDRNALAIVDREIRLGAAAAHRHLEHLGTLGFTDDVSLVHALRAGALDDHLLDAAHVLALSIRDELLIANPDYLID